METQFYNECGEYVKDYPEVELRFKAVASEIYAAHTAADFALKQAFVQTATGEYLDKHAEMRGITRKGASRATGYLSFFVTQEYEENVDIPEGTICSVKDNPLIQFATNYRAFILPGDTGVTIEASALNEGEEYNVPADSITVMVNPPEYIYSVTNQRAFTGGSDPESDESLRQRIIDSDGSIYYIDGSGYMTRDYTDQDGIKYGNDGKAINIYSLDEKMKSYLERFDSGEKNIVFDLSLCSWYVIRWFIPIDERIL